MNLKNINLNLLVTLNDLLKTKNITKSAKNLHLTQPAVSTNLSHLREIFKDELLVKRGRNMVLTPKAQELTSPLKEILLSTENLLKTDNKFNPQKGKHHFNIAATDYAEHTIIPDLLQKIKKYDIHLTLKTIPYHKLIDISLDDFDLILGNYQFDNFFSTKLFEESFVIVANKNHPIVNCKAKLDDYLLEKHIKVNIDKDIDFVTNALGDPDPRDFVLSVNHISSAIIVMEKFPYIMTMPARLANIFCRTLNLKFNKLPFKTKLASVNLLWPKHLNNDSKNIWLRASITELFINDRVNK
ncbi:MAG TPA: LysR family transcriptional regulator [Victivallales bacterium]|nr:LysR family transcriptional regulator [Victivallales bacterium]